MITEFSPRLKGEPMIYGDGSGMLIHRIKEALREVPGDQPKDPRLCRDAIYEVLRTFAAEAFDHNPDCEVYKSDEGTEGRMTYKVGYEAGPWEWAIPASFTVMNATGRLCEPHYSFDLCLYDVE